MPNGTTVSGKPPSLSRQSTVLVALFLALSFLSSLAILSFRNIYDDEYSNLVYVGMSVPHVIHEANSVDVHPPGMYLLTKFAYQAIPSARWMTIFVLLLLYAGLAFYLYTLAPLFPNTPSRIGFLLLATLHPQLLMWGNTIRWYGWWVGPALVTLIVALQPATSEEAPKLPRLTYRRATLLGLLLVSLFYLNYITLVFGAALGLVMLFRYGLRPWKQYLLTLAIFAVLVFPQIHPFITVHIPGGREQRSGLLLSLARLVQAILCSEAYLPWHPLSIAALLLFVALIVAGLLRARRLASKDSPSAALLTSDRGLASIVLFSLLFFCLVALGGFGVKPRNGLLLTPLLAVPFALVLGQLRSPKLKTAILIFIALWSSVGIEHLIRRHGLTKMNMNNHPEEVEAYVQKTQGTACPVVVTYDAVLDFKLITGPIHPLQVLTLTSSGVRTPAGSPTFSVSGCTAIDLYLVTSYLGGLGAGGKQADAEIKALAASLPGPAETQRLSPDPDAPTKRKLTFIGGASDLPDYRYVVQFNRITPTQYETVERSLPDFAPNKETVH